MPLLLHTHHTVHHRHNHHPTHTRTHADTYSMESRCWILFNNTGPIPKRVISSWGKSRLHYDCITKVCPRCTSQKTKPPHCTSTGHALPRPSALLSCAAGLPCVRLHKNQHQQPCNNHHPPSRLEILISKRILIGRLTSP